MDEIAICNTALGRIGQKPIMSFSDVGSVRSDLCAQNYPSLRDAVLEEGRFGFGTRRYVWTSTGEDYTWGYGQQVVVPNEVVNVIEVHKDPLAHVNGVSNVDWRLEQNDKGQRVIVSNYSKIYTKCVVKVENTDLFSPLYREALIDRIAAELAIPLTGKKSLRDTYMQSYMDKMPTATGSDGAQGKSDRARGRSLTTLVR